MSESTLNRRLERSKSVIQYSSTLLPIRNELDGYLMALRSNPRSVLNKEVVKRYSDRQIVFFFLRPFKHTSSVYIFWVTSILLTFSLSLPLPPPICPFFSPSLALSLSLFVCLSLSHSICFVRHIHSI